MVVIISDSKETEKIGTMGHAPLSMYFMCPILSKSLAFEI